VTLTLAHAAPEVVAGGRGGVSGDVYALASTLYAALAGRAAFVADADETMVPMLARIASAPVPDLRPDGVPDVVCSAIERGMAKDPADRPASAEAFGVALHGALASEGVHAPTPPLLLPGMALATFEADPAAASTGSGYTGDRTITGWHPAAAAAAADEAAAARTPVAAEPAARRRINAWAIVAGLAVVALAFVAVRGLDGPSVASPGVTPSDGVSNSRTPTPTPSGSDGSSPTPATSSTTSATPGATRSSAPTPSGSRTTESTPATSSTGSTTGGATRSSTPTRSTAPAVPVALPSSKPAPTTTPTPVPVPKAPQTVRASAPSVVAMTGGTNSVPSQVTLTVSWSAPTSTPAPTSYDLRWVAVGGPQNGVATSAASTSALSASVTVPAPTSGYYRWQVRSTVGSQTSTWVTARVVVPSVVGRRMANARYSLRAIGLPSTTYNQPTAVTARIGRVAAQSLTRGRPVVVGSSIALGKGVKA
jgi:hypothetical protein